MPQPESFVLRNWPGNLRQASVSRLLVSDTPKNTKEQRTMPFGANSKAALNSIQFPLQHHEHGKQNNQRHDVCELNPTDQKHSTDTSFCATWKSNGPLLSLNKDHANQRDFHKK